MSKKTFLTPRERTMRAFNFERGDRVASGFGVPEQYAAQFEAKYGPDYKERFNQSCMSLCIPTLAWPGAPGKWVEDGKDKVWWYTDVLFHDYDEADKLVFPDPRNSPDVFANLEKNLKARPDNAQACAIIGPITALLGSLGGLHRGHSRSGPRGPAGP